MSSDPRSSAEIAGRYRLDSRLGFGGMSTVHLALDLRLERQVAVKLLAEHLADDPAFVSRFQREAQAAARLVHPNIVQVFDSGRDERSGQYFIVMEYIEGSSCAEILRDQNWVEVDEALSIVAQACEGLHYAHRHGVVHRDVKPGNLLRAREGEVKLADFGIAKATEQSSITQIGSVLTQVDQALATEARFHIPRTTMITDDIEIARLDRALVTELRSDLGTTDFAHNSFDLYGVDFIFSSTSARFELRGPFRNKQPYESLTMRELKTYLDERNIPDSRVLSVKVAFEDADGSTRTQKLKNIIDYIADDDKVVLVSGKWMRFNQDYLDYLDAYVRGIDTEPVEAELLAITGGEPEFNTSPAVAAAGFHVADKDFDILRTTSSTSIEAWDLQRDNTVYAVKFGTAQKLGYVCDQALAVLEILRNQANVREIPHFERYCLWLGYRVAGDTPLQNISLSGSIILKQKIENWARKCRELGITPVIRISRWIRPTPLTSSSPDPAAAGFTAAQH